MALECAADVRVLLSRLHTIMHGQGGWQPVPEHDQTPEQHGVAWRPRSTDAGTRRRFQSRTSGSSTGIS